MTDAIVVGAGVSGLSAAYRLREEGRSVVVVEQADRVGGMIRSERLDGYLIEHGPNSIQSATPLLDRYVRELDLSDQRVEASSTAKVRYLVKHGRPLAAPSSPTALLTSNLFGTRAKFRLMREPFVPAAPPEREESVADFVRRRLGQEFLDYAINPFVAGVFAGDPERLSVKYAFPLLVELERKHGSIIKGQIEKRRHPASMADTDMMFSFRDGIAQLVEALGKRSGDVRTRGQVEAVSLDNGGWTVAADGESLRARSVICTMPLHRLAETRLPKGFPIEPLAEVTYAPLTVVYQGYRRHDVQHPLDGFGLLVPEVERRFRILGTLFTSSVFPNRAPKDAVLLTTFVGGMRHPELALGSDDDLQRIVEEDLKPLLGIRGRPVFRSHVTWPLSIPQYMLGYGAVLDAIEAAEAQFPGFFLAGNFRDGVSVADAARSGDDAGARCNAFLRT